MLCPIFTLDYEVHGNGDGDPIALMVEPTWRLMDQLERFGAKLTIMADVAEILRFRDYRDEYGQDAYGYDDITKQLRAAVARGHDVQLHLHTSWFGARHESDRWHQDWQNYSFADLPLERIRDYLAAGKAWLEELLQPVDGSYRCDVFRAANWSMHPSHNAVRALKELGFRVETSVFKWGHRSGLVSFDYAHAHHPFLPWRAASHDVCLRDETSTLWEFPIYAENRHLGAFLSPLRFYRAWLSRVHRLPRSGFGPESSPRPGRSLGGRVRQMARRSAWKADFNQCTGRQLTAALHRAERSLGSATTERLRSFVLIGHSKLFTPFNELMLAPFLRQLARHPDRFRSCRFRDLLPATSADAAPFFRPARPISLINASV